ncbi:MAG TPA: hypothetical protein PLY68_04505 [Myxococcota bacterium]|nr:hypothetical protein [Myxococcota bacterium]HPB50357.1 hypothetical protein [Myxococcota bacterium]HQP95440.1 hypothetical protein [Myxococcota bacterium]
MTDKTYFRLTGPCTAILMILAACAPDPLDRTDPIATYNEFNDARARADFKQVFVLLDPNVSQKIAETWTQNRETILMIESNIPPRLRANFLNEIGTPEIRSARSPAHLYELSKLASGATEFNLGQRVASKLRWINVFPQGSNNRLIETLGGEKLTFNASLTGIYSYMPSPEEDGLRIQSEAVIAGQNLDLQKSISMDLYRPRQR